MKKAIIHGLISGGASSVAAIIYNIVYSYLLAVDFSKIVNIAALISVNVFAAMAASLAYLFFSKKSKSPDVWFNIFFLFLTFASFLIPFFKRLPLDLEAPELFIGLAIPMHLFPLVFWLVSKPGMVKVSARSTN